jgi:Tol biopolymer transport system component
MSCLLVVFGDCSQRSHKVHSSEAILFVTEGKLPFQDYVYQIDPDGLNLERLLSPTSNRSYIAISGNSLQSNLVVTAHETSQTGQIEDHIYLYRPKSGEWHRLIMKEGLEGDGVLSPDESKVVFTFTTKERPREYRLWIADLSTGETRQLTTGEENTWDAHPSWKPDSQEIAFIRFRLADGSFTSKLMTVSSSSGEPTTLLNEIVANACYSPDGKQVLMLTDRGLEILDASAGRTVIVPWSEFANYKFEAGGLVWDRTQNKIAFALLNTQSNQYELWTVSSDGKNTKQLYTVKSGRIHVASFVKT